nr:phage regulatory CII family protein [uncultured Rhodoferax sp.]
MNILAATRLLTRGYPSGLEGIALILSKSPTSLRHEIAGEKGNKLGAEDVVDMTNAALAAKQDNALVILSAMASNCGCEIRRLSGTATKTGMQAVSGGAIEFAELVASAVGSMADGVVNDNELKEAERECSELMTQLQALMSAMAAMNLAGKPTGQGYRS